MDEGGFGCCPLGGDAVCCPDKVKTGIEYYANYKNPNKKKKELIMSPKKQNWETMSTADYTNKNTRRKRGNVQGNCCPKPYGHENYTKRNKQDLSIYLWNILNIWTPTKFHKN